MGKLDGKIAVVTGGTSGMALASARRFVEEGAHVFITGRVHVLSPAQVATPIQEEMFDAKTKGRFEALIPRGKRGSPEEVATAALFLASDESNYVNGVDLAVDGGTSAI